MPNTIDGTGLTVNTQAEIVADLTTGFQNIFGPDANFNSNSPDGQMINILAQAVADMLSLLQNLYAMFSLDNAYGTTLDSLVAINGIQRKQGTQTVTPVTVTVASALTLQGLDLYPSAPFTVQDSAGNQYQLLVTQSPSSPGPYIYNFQCTQIGPVTPTLNTITVQVTTVLGVTAVNNPSAATGVGVAEETDAQLRVRQTQSFQLASTGPASSIQAQLLNQPDVVDALVYENATAGIVNTVPAHSVWVIVNGGTSPEIADVIYGTKGPGCGMKGSVSYVLARPGGQSFTAYWDTAVAQPLYISFTAVAKYPGLTLNKTAYPAALAAALVYRLGAAPSIGDIINAMATIDPNCVVTLGSNQGVSRDNATFSTIVYPTATPDYFTVAAADISVS